MALTRYSCIAHIAIPLHRSQLLGSLLEWVLSSRDRRDARSHSSRNVRTRCTMSARHEGHECTCSAQPAQQTMWPQGTKTTWILASMHTTHSRVRRRRSSSSRRCACMDWGAELRMTRAALAMEGGWEQRMRSRHAGRAHLKLLPPPLHLRSLGGLHARQALQHLPLELLCP